MCWVKRRVQILRIQGLAFALLPVKWVPGGTLPWSCCWSGEHSLRDPVRASSVLGKAASFCPFVVIIAVPAASLLQPEVDI